MLMDGCERDLLGLIQTIGCSGDGMLLVSLLTIESSNSKADDFG